MADMKTNNTSIKPKISTTETTVSDSDSSGDEKMDTSTVKSPSQFSDAMSAILHLTVAENINGSVKRKHHDPDTLRRRTIRVGSKIDGIDIVVQELARDTSKYVDDLKYSLRQKNLLHIVDAMADVPDEDTLTNLMTCDRIELFDLLNEKRASGAYTKREIKPFVDAVVGVVAQAAADKCAMKVWPAGQLLAEYLFTNPSLVADKTVLEMGAGCGLPSILCCKLGARRVYATDAKQFTKTMNSLREMSVVNDVSDRMRVRDLTWGRFTKKNLKRRPHIILGSDIFFDERHFEDILTNVRFYFKKGCEKFLCVVQSKSGRAMTQRLSLYITRHGMRVDEVEPTEVRDLIFRSSYLKIEHAGNLRIVVITQQTPNPRNDRRNSLVLRHSVSRGAMHEAAASISSSEVQYLNDSDSDSDDDEDGPCDKRNQRYKATQSPRKHRKTHSMSSSTNSEEEKFQLVITPPAM